MNKTPIGSCSLWSCCLMKFEQSPHQQRPKQMVTLPTCWSIGIHTNVRLQVPKESVAPSTNQLFSSSSQQCPFGFWAFTSRNVGSAVWTRTCKAHWNRHAHLGRLEAFVFKSRQRCRILKKETRYAIKLQSNSQFRPCYNWIWWRWIKQLRHALMHKRASVAISKSSLSTNNYTNLDWNYKWMGMLFVYQDSES